MARAARIVVMTDEKIKAALQEMADGMGITVSALCAYILGQFVYQQSCYVKPLLSKFQTLALEEARRFLEEGGASEGE